MALDERGAHLCRYQTKQQGKRSDRPTERSRLPARRCYTLGRNILRLRIRTATFAIYSRLAVACARTLPIASGHCSPERKDQPTKGSAARSTLLAYGLPAVRVPKVWLSMLRCSGDPAVRKPTREMRGLSLQQGRHARLGVLSDQHRTSKETRRKSARFAGLQNKYRFRVSAVPWKSGFYSLERIQQRPLSTIPRRNRTAPLRKLRVTL